MDFLSFSSFKRFILKTRTQQAFLLIIICTRDQRTDNGDDDEILDLPDRGIYAKDDRLVMLKLHVLGVMRDMAGACTLSTDLAVHDMASRARPTTLQTMRDYHYTSN